MDGKLRDIPYVRMDFEEIQKKIDEAAEGIAAAEDYETVRELLMENQKLVREVDENHTLSMIRMYQDTTDEYYRKEFAKQNNAAAMRDNKKFNLALISSPFAEKINQEFGPEFLIGLDKENRLFAKGKELQVKEQELTARYRQIKAEMKFEFQEKTLSEGELRPVRENPDREIRKEAVTALYRGFTEQKEALGEILDELVKVRNEIARANGFDNYLDYMNLEKGRREYGEQELAVFRRQVKEEALPLMERLHEQQRQRLGLEQMTVYDYNLIFPDGNPKPAGDIKQLYEAAGKMYYGLEQELGEFYDDLIEHELIDAAFSTKKVTGMGFCTQLSKTRMPFVFANSDGTMKDVAVFTHELGHAYQSYLSMKKQPLLEYQNMVNDIAEIPSKTMEVFAYPYAEEFFGKDAEKFLHMHQHEIISEIMFYTMTDEYEAWLYANPDAALEERCMEYDRIFHMFHPGVDNREFAEEIRQGAMLFTNMGIFMFPKYLISYVLSEMCALEFKERMETEPEQAWRDYKLLCETGGSLGYAELLSRCNLHPAYEEGAVARALRGFKQKFMK